MTALSLSRGATAALVFASLCLALGGCGPKGDPNPPRARVSGTITLDGEPVPAGIIEFIPVEPGQLAAQGTVGDDGRFVIEQAGGPSPGEYKVEIRCAKKTGRRIRSMSSPDPDGTIDERVAVIPDRYHSPTTLKQTIKPGDNALEFKLTSK
jgi:hypothetical protein